MLSDSDSAAAGLGSGAVGAARVAVRACKKYGLFTISLMAALDASGELLAVMASTKEEASSVSYGLVLLAAAERCETTSKISGSLTMIMALIFFSSNALSSTSKCAGFSGSAPAASSRRSYS